MTQGYYNTYTLCELNGHTNKTELNNRKHVIMQKLKYEEPGYKIVIYVTN